VRESGERRDGRKQGRVKDGEEEKEDKEEKRKRGIEHTSFSKLSFIPLENIT
jgi:hypothetical protein